jgi:hypothetical protein
MFTALIAAIPSGVTAADVAAHDCYCTDKTGARVELGVSICMNVDGRSFIARCEMSLNNPMWRELSDGCLSSSNQTLQSPEPAQHAPRVDTAI